MIIKRPDQKVLPLNSGECCSRLANLTSISSKSIPLTLNINISEMIVAYLKRTVKKNLEVYKMAVTIGLLAEDNNSPRWLWQSIRVYFQLHFAFFRSLTLTTGDVMKLCSVGFNRRLMLIRANRDDYFIIIILFLQQRSHWHRDACSYNFTVCASTNILYDFLPSIIQTSSCHVVGLDLIWND